MKITKSYLKQIIKEELEKIDEQQLELPFGSQIPQQQIVDPKPTSKSEEQKKQEQEQIKLINNQINTKQDEIKLLKKQLNSLMQSQAGV